MRPATASAYAPGRVELLGNHTDYNEGLVLAAAIDRGLTVSGSRRDDHVISISSKTLARRIEIPRSALHAQTEEGWANYALGVASELIARGIPIDGFSAEVDGDLPAGCGLSSSAAFEVATAFFLLKLCGLALPSLEIAKVCQRAEHRFVGVQSGLLDQVTSIFGRADQLVFFDCRSEKVRNVPFPAELALIITQSGTKRELSKGEYNERRKQTLAASHALGIGALRDISSSELARRHEIDSLLRRRAAHVVGENERVKRALNLLACGDSRAFGALMNASHESSRTNFENSTRELDLLVDLARELPGVLGARLTGAGFGGATVTLCERKFAAHAADELARRYAEKTGMKPQTFVCRIADGAS